MSIKLPDLPYNKNALVPHISSETLEFHYEKHHKTYLVNLNNLIKGTVFDKKNLEEIVCNSSGEIYNNAAQVWNHTFYWNCLTPNASDCKITDQLDSAINLAFHSFSVFKEKFTNMALKNFGSGWTWLVKETNGKLTIVSTSNAGTPITAGAIPLMTIDTWEHAYYIDYRNSRLSYIEHFWDLVNWKFVSKNFSN